MQLFQLLFATLLSVLSVEGHIFLRMNSTNIDLNGQFITKHPDGVELIAGNAGPEYVGHGYVDAGFSVDFTLHKDGTFGNSTTALSILTDNWAHDQTFVLSGDESAESFSIKDGKLLYNGNDTFAACPGEVTNKYENYLSLDLNCPAAYEITLDVIEVP
ncbi:uncharacterized protein PRCAT00005833001 [Priceomyces carsonii]|uniref:uncharacterized protein n=1 Tax=Priceomyces carsonii TaxID=28549 RepID=UPI002EDAFC2C|nr:unnamed protein product [Priceomyces carsonii]